MQPEAPAPAAADPGAVKPRLIPGSEQTEGEVPASPKDEADLDQVINKAMMMIHGKKSRDAVVKALHNPRDSVAELVGRTAANILMSISEQKGAATNEPLDPETMQEAAAYVIPELMTVGVAAGVFPFDGPEEGAGEVGQGTTEFDQQVRLATLEAVKAYGETQLRQPGAEAKSAEAGDEWARQVSAEVANGTADPKYMAMARPKQLISEEPA
jgi:hypothetical protein